VRNVGVRRNEVNDHIGTKVEMGKGEHNEKKGELALCVRNSDISISLKIFGHDEE
jgi:hypothetical protein